MTDDFEGKPIEANRLKLTSHSAGVEIDIGTSVRNDDIVHMVVEARIVGVNHQVNQRSNKLIRFHTARLLTAALVPWDAENPDDTGVLRD